MKVYNINSNRVDELKSQLLALGLTSNLDGTCYYNDDYELLYKINII